MFTELLTKTFYGNRIDAWLFAFVVILIALIGGKILYWIFSNIIKKLTPKKETKVDDMTIDMIEEPIILMLGLLGLYYSLNILTFPDLLDKWLNHIFSVLVILNLAWILSRFLDSLFKEYLVPLIEKSNTNLDNQLLPLIRKGSKFIIWTTAIIVAFNNAGYNVAALLAGLGIGGLAVALAAKDTLSNIFGGLTIFIDKPFKINDRIIIDSYEGKVKEIGLRSSRIETMEGRIVTIPNSKFAESAIQNVTLEPSRKITLNIGLIYDTKPKDIEKALKILEDISKKNKNTEDKVLISFNKFSPSSIDLLLIYYIKKSADVLQTQTEINLEIFKQFNKNKLNFAFPTQTIYTKKA